MRVERHKSVYSRQEITFFGQGQQDEISKSTEMQILTTLVIFHNNIADKKCTAGKNQTFLVKEDELKW